LKTIRFSHDWNRKLTGGNELFSTIRRYIFSKSVYYSQALGEIFSVELKGKKVCEAELVAVKSCRLNEIPLAFLMVDTGLTGEEKIDDVFSNFGISLNGDVLILVFKKMTDGNV
jgi:hypothetical protein